MDTKTLEKVGLTKNESIVYTTLLQLGTSKTGEILTASGLNSGKIYEILEGLKAKGLVSESNINNIRHFTAAPPTQLIDYLEKKKHELDKEEKTIHSMLPNLEKLRKAAKGKAKSVTYVGFKGFKTSIEEAEADLKPGEEVLAMGVTGIKDKRFNDFWINQMKKRVKTRRRSKTIVSEKGGYFEQIKSKYSEVKSIPMFTPAAVTIFGKDKVLLLNYKEPYTFTLIYDNEITTSFINFFYQMWDQKAKTFHGIKGIKTLLYELLEAGGDEHHTIASSKESLMLGEKFWHDYHKKRADKGIKAKLIFNESVKAWCSKNPYPLTKYKFTSTGFEPLTETIIRNDKIGFIIWTKIPMGIIIDNKEAAKSYDKFFEMMWEQDAKTYKGKEGVETFFNNLLNEKEAWFIGGNFGIKQYFPDYWEKYKKERIKKKQMWHDLIDADVKPDLAGEPCYDYKILPSELKSPHVICITENKVANIIWAGENTTIFVFENKEIVNSYKKYFKHLSDQRTQTYQGNEGFKSCYERILNEMKKGDTLLVLGAPKEANRKFEKFLFDWHNRREKKHVNAKILYNHDSREFGKIREKMALTQVKYMKEEMETPAWIVIFNDFVVTINVHGEPICFLIQDKNSADSYRKYFEMLWKQAEK